MDVATPEENSTGRASGAIPEEGSTGHAWGVGHVVAGVVIGTVASVVAAGIIFTAGGYEEADVLPLSMVAVMQAALWIGLLGVPLWLVAARGVRWADLGWGGAGRDVFFRRSLARWDCWQGLGIGVVTQVAVVPATYLPILLLTDDLDVSGPARELVDKATGSGILLLVLSVVVGAPIVEELFFRGLTLRALEARMRPRVALIVSALVFGAVHLQVLQFPALVAIGLVCGWLAQRDGRLGRAIWAHLGFNGVTVLMLLVAFPAG